MSVYDGNVENNLSDIELQQLREQAVARQMADEYFEQYMQELVESGRITVIDDANLTGEQ